MEINYDYLLKNGINVVIALFILIASHVLGRYVDNKIYVNAKDKNTSIILLGHVMYYTITVIGFLLILRIYGVEIASIVAIIATIGFAIGLSLQGSLSDIASGILVTFFKIFNIGDVIQIGDIEGKVVDFKLIHTVLEEVSTKTIVTIPNRKLQDTPVQNLSKQGFHYFVIQILLSNKNVDFKNILSVIRKELKDTTKFPDVLQNMRHSVSVNDMSGVGTLLSLRLPITTEPDLGIKRGAIRSAVRNVLETNGITLMDPTAIVRS